jgi:hypothetical protein
MSAAGLSPHPQGRPEDAAAPSGGSKPVELGGALSGARPPLGGGREATSGGDFL